MNRKGLILLVEDNPDDVELTLRAFEMNDIGHRIAVVHDGQEALDYVFSEGAYGQRDETTTPRLVLLDLKLPKLDGHEVLRRIRCDDRTNRLPVVVLTSSTEDRDVERSYDLGANSFVCKPLDIIEFLGTIRQITSYWLDLNTPSWNSGRGR